MTGKLTKKPQTRRDELDAVRLKKAGDPAHINEREAALLAREMPAAQGPVIGTGLLAEAGRRGDTLITDINAAEAKLLKRRGGAGTRNPRTGLLEFYGDGSSDDSSHGDGNGGLGDAATGSNNGPGDNGNGTYSGGGYGGYGGYTDFSGWGTDPSMGPNAREDEIGNYSQNGGYVNWSDYAMNGYKPADTWGRVLQEYFSPSVPTSKYGPTTGANLGIAGAIAGGLVGGPMSGLMGLGAAMGRAQSPESQRASMAEMSSRGGMNSTGNDTGLSGAASSAAGAASGARTSGLPGNALAGGTPAGQTVDPVTGLIVAPSNGGTGEIDAKSHTLTGLPQPVQNLLMDYIWRGRQGSGVLGW